MRRLTLVAVAAFLGIAGGGVACGGSSDHDILPIYRPSTSCD